MTTDVPPERASLDLLKHVVFNGVSAALLPNGSLVCGVAADRALDQSRRDESPSTSRSSGSSNSGGGLILVHSHRQRLNDFRDHARALGLAVRQRGSLLHGASLLLLNNNAPLLYQRASYGRSVQWGPHADDAIGWLRAYAALPLRIRLLITSSINCGYFCGELQALSAAARITSRFPWVLAFSGPDALPTPDGLRRLGLVVSSARPKHEAGGGMHPDDDFGDARAAAFLYDPFPAPRAHFRISMDIFLYRPNLLRAGANGTWARATELCLRATNRIPETILAEVIIAHNVRLPVVKIRTLGTCPCRC